MMRTSIPFNPMNNKEFSCTRDCRDRSSTCHATCEKYKKWKAEFEELKKQEQNMNLEYYMRERSMRNANKNYKKRRH